MGCVILNFKGEAETGVTNAEVRKRVDRSQSHRIAGVTRTVSVDRGEELEKESE